MTYESDDESITAHRGTQNILRLEVDWGSRYIWKAGQPRFVWALPPSAGASVSRDDPGDLSNEFQSTSSQYLYRCVRCTMCPNHILILSGAGTMLKRRVSSNDFGMALL